MTNRCWNTLLPCHTAVPDAIYSDIVLLVYVGVCQRPLCRIDIVLRLCTWHVFLFPVAICRRTVRFLFCATYCDLVIECHLHVCMQCIHIYCTQCIFVSDVKRIVTTCTMKLGSSSNLVKVALVSCDSHPI